MADRFWVGNGGNISDTAHWSLTSGGAGGASVPISGVNAKFDLLSFTLTGQIVTVDVAFACADMDFTGVTNSPTLAGSQDINCFGSWTNSAAMTITHNGIKGFYSTTTGKTITSAGVSMNSIIQTNGAGGGWTLQDALTCNFLVNTQGAFDSNGKTMNVLQIRSNSTLARSLSLGASVINNSGDWLLDVTTNLTFTAGTSTINMTGASKSFKGGGKTYNNVNFTGTPSTIEGSNTFNALNVAAGKTLNITSGTTQTITNPTLNGTTASPSTLQSTVAGTPATIALPAGRYFIRHTSIKDITITGATAVTSIAGTNVSGNTGITFVTKFEIGRIKNDGSFNWYSTATGAVTKVSG